MAEGNVSAERCKVRIRMVEAGRSLGVLMLLLLVGALVCGAEGTGQSKETVAQSESQALGRTLLLYVPNRVVDLVDILGFNVGVGIGDEATVGITKAVRVGARVMNRRYVVGMSGRHPEAFGLVSQGVVTYGGAFSILEYSSEGKSYDMPGEPIGTMAEGHSHEIDIYATYQGPVVWPDGAGTPPWHSRRAKITFYKAALMIFTPVIEVRFRTMEFIDFLGGLATFDPSNDDIR